MKRVESDGPDVYSPGRNKKKNAKTIISAMADVLGRPAAVAMVMM